MKLTIPNAQQIDPTGDEELLNEFGDLFSIDEKVCYSINSRRSDGRSERQQVGATDIVEVTLEDGSRWFLGEEELRELEDKNPSARRGASRDELVLDASLFSEQTSRGFASNVFKKVRVFALKLLPDLKTEGEALVGDLVEEEIEGIAKSLLIDPAAFYLARRLEKKLATQGVSRVCRLSMAETQNSIELEPVDKIEPVGSDAAEQKILILLHGTLSSTAGSFGGLWSNHLELFKSLVTFYNGNVYALEHCTLTQSPIQNALQLAEALPDKCELHLLSHSRGGIVGELLCRGTRKEQSAFTEDEIALFREQRLSDSSKRDVSAAIFNALRKHHKNESLRLDALNKVLTAREITVSRFVRVACPARGTTLASGKLNRWANRSMNAIGLLTGFKVNPLYQAFEAFTLGILESKSKAEVLPGLQAQMPGSALIHVLNNPETSVPADLSIVAGDIQLKSGINWKKIPLWVSDKFFGGEHDLVVNTASMDGGSGRDNDIRQLRLVDEHVNHFSYFSNSDSGNQILNCFLQEPSERFLKIEQPDEVFIPRSKDRVHSEDQPVLVLVPGILGTELSHDGSKIWINAIRLALGGISRLAIDSEPVQAEELVNLPYSQFIRHFERTHDIHVCPYDWRRSLRESAQVLATLLEAILSRQQQNSKPQPIRIVAHSMGGLVMRMVISQSPDLWERIKSRSGSRFIMAGTPTNGSYSINRILAGELKLIKLLALADIRNSKKDITDIAAELPGVATMLPGFGKHEWLLDSTWVKLLGMEDASNWSRISAELLTNARLERKLILETPLENDYVAYVAGKSDWTPADMKLEGEEVSFEDTEAGDGQVTWEDGIPKSLKNVWYQPSVHGSLLACPEHFDAWQELLERGKTSRLARNPSALRSDAKPATRTVRDDDPVDYLPDERSLTEIALAMEPFNQRRNQEVSSTLRVTVTHGDLGFARFPVAVGHYEFDSILAAEKAVDRVLDGRLTERHSINQYPGPISTCEVIFTRKGSYIPEGALIVGLGRIGELTLPKLQRTLTSAMTKYILEYYECWIDSGRQKPESAVGLSVLLIGSGLGALSLKDSVTALIRAAIAANEAVGSLERYNLKLLEEIEIIELWEDLALEAAHAASEVARQLGSSRHSIDVEEELDSRDGGRSRSRFWQNPDWWHTIMVQKIPDEDAFQFANYTRHARTELTDEPVDMHFVDQFLESIIHLRRNDSSSGSSPQKALFELLLPSALKEAAPDSDKIRMMLDEHSARIPWEMLVDGWSDEKIPLAASKQMIRQLSVDVGRSVRDTARGKDALVVGDPPGDGYPPLRGARDEATRVCKLLEQYGGYHVDAYISDDASDQESHTMGSEIVQSLLSNEYTILHFAAHGSFARSTQSIIPKNDANQGMVIGNGLRLTPLLVNKIRKAPTLVFLNCCHLGFIENRAGDETVRYNQIAANLATQFIMIGAKVVVAAGWEVEDEPARRFAEHFYTSILANNRLATAISSAREKVYKEYPHSNSFGAYQCWGDPEFRLDPTERRTGRAGQGTLYRSPTECSVEAENVRNQARTADTGEINELKSRARELHRHLFNRYGDPWEGSATDWERWGQPKVRALCSLGLAFGELGEFAESIRILRKACSLWPSLVTFRDLEQLGNFECRYAFELSVYPDLHPPADIDPEYESAKQLLRVGEGRLKELLKRYNPKQQQSSQREILGLVASAARRRVLVMGLKGDAVSKALREMAHYYGLGWTKKPEGVSLGQPLQDYVTEAHNNNCDPDNYAFFNFAISWVLLNRYSDHPLADSMLEALRVYTDVSIRPHGRYNNFWDGIRPSEARILHYLDDNLRRKLDVFPDSLDLVAEIKSGLSFARGRFGSARQWASIRDFLEFIAAVLDRSPDTSVASRRDERRDKLAGIREIIEYVKSAS